MYIFFKIFCWTKVHFVGPLIAPILDFVCPPSYGFQSHSGSLICMLTCLRTINLRVTSGATSAFSTNMGVHCNNVFRNKSYLYYMWHQMREPLSLWNPWGGSHEVQNRDNQWPHKMDLGLTKVIKNNIARRFQARQPWEKLRCVQNHRTNNTGFKPPCWRH